MNKHRILKIGLTGGIGCGKSTVTHLFAQLGTPIIDADHIAHQLVQPGQPALEKIEQKFGGTVINDDGSLNRTVLRNIVFSDPVKKQQLEAILHPLIYAQMQNQIKQCTAAYVILSIPLLLETHRQHFVDRILVVDCPLEQQIKRVKQRDQLSDQQIQAIIASQIPRQQRLYAGDDIINNSGKISDLAEQIKKLHNLYISPSFSQNHPS